MIVKNALSREAVKNCLISYELRIFSVEKKIIKILFVYYPAYFSVNILAMLAKL